MSDHPHGPRTARRPDDRPRSPSPSTPAAEEGFVGYDDEVNSRYEEIKRGGTYITELQHMTMVQLQQLARDEDREGGDGSASRSRT